MKELDRQNNKQVSAALDYGALLLVFLLVLAANYLIFMYVPNERVMGPVQRIFYFHVGSAFATYIAILGMVVGGLSYLATREKRFDLLQCAAGEVGLLFCTIVLFTGMVWGHSAWNTIFSWKEPRLVSFLVLWLLFLSFNLMRWFGDQARLPQHSAVLSILAAITVPVVVYSVKFLSHLAQLHPVVVENRGLQDSAMESTFWFTNFTLIVLTVYLIWLKFRVAKVAATIEEQ